MTTFHRHRSRGVIGHQATWAGTTPASMSLLAMAKLVGLRPQRAVPASLASQRSAAAVSDFEALCPMSSVLHRCSDPVAPFGRMACLRPALTDDRKADRANPGGATEADPGCRGRPKRSCVRHIERFQSAFRSCSKVMAE